MARALAGGGWGLSPRLRGNRVLPHAQELLRGTIPAPAGKPHSRLAAQWQGRDYPRACGETDWNESDSTDDSGLSPRLRGNRLRHAPSRRPRGTIPAPAGKPRYRARRQRQTRDYPRACGETAIVSFAKAGHLGLSPRLRGNRVLPHAQELLRGTIPAPAGKPHSRLAAQWQGRDYPRACGETDWNESDSTDDSGLSPRLRGNRLRHAPSRRPRGTIPAPAGKPRYRARRQRQTRDYPRACGETAIVSFAKAGHLGLSPRLRGNLVYERVVDFLVGTIPAPAGKPSAAAHLRQSIRDYPRACGETEPTRTTSTLVSGLSPRLRGNHRQPERTLRRTGTIPAPAGKPRERPLPKPWRRDYPRACGETASASLTR